MRVLLICLSLSTLLALPVAAADTVVLRDGCTLSGTVTMTRDSVEVRTEHGTLTLPAWRVARVSGDSFADSDGDGASTPPSVQEAERGAAGVLDAPVTLRLSDEPLAAALEEIGRSGGLRIALSPAVRADARTVSVALDEAAARRAIDLVLDGTGYACAVGDDGIVSVLPPGDPRLYEVRLYSVADLLIDRSELVLGSGRPGGGARPGGAGALPQYAPSAVRRADGSDAREGARHGPGGQPHVPLPARQGDEG